VERKEEGREQMIADASDDDGTTLHSTGEGNNWR